MLEKTVEYFKGLFNQEIGGPSGQNLDHDFITHLKEDHDKQRNLGVRLFQATSEKERQTLRNEFYDELYPHMLGEEASIFDFMKGAEREEVRESAQEALQEHHIAKILLRELMDIKLDSDVFRAKVKALKVLNERHMDEEEKEHFPALSKVASNEELEKLFKAYESAEEQAKG